jgi:hypothetical protein
MRSFKENSFINEVYRALTIIGIGFICTQVWKIPTIETKVDMIVPYVDKAIDVEKRVSVIEVRLEIDNKKSESRQHYIELPFDAIDLDI